MTKISAMIKKYEEIIRYGFFGVLTTIVNFIVFYYFNSVLETSYILANALAIFISIVFAYFTNRSFVFQQKQKMSLKEAVNFYLSRLSTLGIDMIMMYVLVTLLDFNDKIIKLIVQVVVIVLNYVFSKFFVFNKKEVKYEK